MICLKQCVECLLLARVRSSEFDKAIYACVVWTKIIRCIFIVNSVLEFFSLTWKSWGCITLSSALNICIYIFRLPVPLLLLLWECLRFFCYWLCFFHVLFFFFVRAYMLNSWKNLDASRWAARRRFASVWSGVVRCVRLLWACFRMPLAGS